MLSLTTYFCIHNYQLIHLKFFYISCTKRITVFFFLCFFFLSSYQKNNQILRTLTGKQNQNTTKSFFPLTAATLEASPAKPSRTITPHFCVH